MLVWMLSLSPLNEDCKTTFTIKDCSNEPVSGATITIERCSDKKLFHTVTDARGEGSFSLCKKEICKTRVAVVGFETKNVPKVGDNCQGNNCTIKICSD
jgi:hypothetical protein